MIDFRDPRDLGPDDEIAAVGSDLSVETLLAAYSRGIFPWPAHRLIPWHCPVRRGVIDFPEFHVPRSVRQAARAAARELTFDRAFTEVISGCAQAARGAWSGGTWIVPEMIAAYRALHAAGHAHSVECRRDGKLVGGLYGVYVKGVFSGESMFFRESNASKHCLVALVSALKSRGLGWLDIQMVTPVTELFGGKYISRAEFLDRLERDHRRKLPKRLSLSD